MPARSISRWETISASFGVSRRIGRKKRDRRISVSRIGVGGPSAAVKADRTRKYKRTKGLGACPLKWCGARMTTPERSTNLNLPWGGSPYGPCLGGRANREITAANLEDGVRIGV